MEGKEYRAQAHLTGTLSAPHAEGAERPADDREFHVWGNVGCYRSVLGKARFEIRWRALAAYKFGSEEDDEQWAERKGSAQSRLM